MLLATIDMTAPPQRVFRAVTSEELTDWWGYGVTRYSGDIRPGGAWLTEGTDAKGEPFAVHGEVLEVEPPYTLVQTTHHWEPRGLITTVTWHFEPITGGTRVLIRHDGFGDAQQSCVDHAAGWEAVLNRLSAHVGGTA
jgi:uncharacterized protein YndB with AHSA1/START domain